MTDVSLHFTLKNQTVNDIHEKLQDLLCSEKSSLNATLGKRRQVLHHCFMPLSMVKDRGWSTAIYDKILNSSLSNKVCWNGVSGHGIEVDRVLMLENLQKLKGTAIFIGDLIDGVKDEYEFAKNLDIQIIHIE